MIKKINYQYYSPKFKKVKFAGENWVYILPTWEKMYQVCLDLGVKILKTHLNFDILVTLIKGGWTWSRTFS